VQIILENEGGEQHVARGRGRCGRGVLLDGAAEVSGWGWGMQKSAERKIGRRRREDELPRCIARAKTRMARISDLITLDCFVLDPWIGYLARGRFDSSS
jgi:hypothetical protein